MSEFDFDSVLARAKNGDVDAQFDLGLRYRTGNGVPKNADRAIQWLDCAAKQQHVASLLQLGMIYSAGEGVAKDASKATDYFSKACQYATPDELTACHWVSGNAYYHAGDYSSAIEHLQYAAQQGLPSAQFRLGFFFERGLLVSRDYKRAFDLYEQAASSLHFPDLGALQFEAVCTSMIKVARMLLDPPNEEIETDFERAVELCKLVFSSGCGKLAGEAAYVIAIEYLRGDVFPRDEPEAEKWCYKGAQLGYDQAVESWGEWVLYGTPKFPSREDWRKLMLDNASSSLMRLSSSAGNPHKRSLDSMLHPLNSLIGLNTVKGEIQRMINVVCFDQEREKRGIAVSSNEATLHSIFLGNPGTGKTTVARLIGSIYKELGLLKSGHVVEVTRKDLVGQYLGQTAPLTMKAIEQALDGILFIDEAYSLARCPTQNDYGVEAIDTLVAGMENYRHRLMVIVAGYPKEMAGFINANPGLKSRFTNEFLFDDYTPDELIEIFVGLARENSLFLNNKTKALLSAYLASNDSKRERELGNARYIREVFEKTRKKLASRVMKSQYSGDNGLDVTGKLAYVLIEDVDLWFNS